MLNSRFFAFGENIFGLKNVIAEKQSDSRLPGKFGYLAKTRLPALQQDWRSLFNFLTKERQDTLKFLRRYEDYEKEQAPALREQVKAVLSTTISAT